MSSTGGHLLQLVALREAWDGFERVWVTFDAPDSRALLAGEEVVHAHSPTNRNVPNLLRNFVLALRVVRRLRPTVIVTTGAGVAVPFAWIGRLFGARVVYVESLTRIDRPSLSYRLIRPVVVADLRPVARAAPPRRALPRHRLRPRVIFVTLGTQAYPFDRLLRGLEGVGRGARRPGRPL